MEPKRVLIVEPDNAFGLSLAAQGVRACSASDSGGVSDE